jgi:putative ABC transport system permease protein
MIKNWILISFRRFFRNKTNSLINLFGLTLGMTVSLLIFLYVRHEFNYDSFHTNADRVYRIVKENPKGNNYLSNPKQAVLPAPLAEVIRQQVTGVEAVSRIASWGGGLTVETSDASKSFNEDSYNAADGDLFRILTFEPVAGNIKRTFINPYTVAISEKTAMKYFGRTNVAGEVLNLTGSKNFGRYTIDLVFRDFPTNSSYDFKVVLRFEDFVKSVQPTDLQNWGNHNYNYLLLTSTVSGAGAVGKQIDDFYYNREKDDPQSDGKSTYYLEALRDFYLHSDINFSGTPRNDINRLYLLSILATFILLVAGINYVNLTTARSVKRAKEVGVRKVVGALPSNLIFQFLGDALALSFFSMLLALATAWSLFPSFSNFIGKEIPFNILHDPSLLLITLVIPTVLGLLAGFYPSFALSAFKPVLVLKGSFSTGSQGNLLRDALTIFQFTISGALIIAVTVVTSQLSYFEKHNPGYDREQIVRLNLRDEGVRAKREVFINELKRNPAILNVSLTSYFPNSVNTQQSRKWVGSSGSTDVSFYTINADPNYLDVFKIKLLDGRFFVPGNPADSNAFVINETAAKIYGWMNPVGMKFTGEASGSAGDTVTIIGVIKDIHIADYRQAIAPMRIGFVKKWSTTLAIKIAPENITSTLAFIEENYHKLATTKTPYTISFFDEDFGKVYKADRQLGTLIYLFSIVAIIIACLGLYGLTMHTVNIRLKEIVIRKILEAEHGQLVMILAWKFLLLILISFAVASPVAYYFMDKWLQNFVYHTDISLVSFLVAIVCMTVIAFATVGGQVWKAALTRPTEGLRSE